jgi:hypothetical protein
MSTMNQGDALEPVLPSAPAAGYAAFTTPALRTALQAQLRAQHDREAPELRRFALLVCTEAHRRGLRVEEVVVLLKQTWLSLPESGHPARTTHATVVEHLISLCIEEYFRGPRGDAASRAD